ncbi:hypothetical protein N7457_007429 [Penicillium paradoxum]|uniref:uncharacterized protein n=1 Tax=Penicillium paradoxum TaxID=176176 RepID=UPI0025484508|nr:uncharacterized protein N7457_007429 [Penicillium paradoxum]KAJ5779709.1 hypothetical protein N7457_007429 [Penicillium paradoxum]
MSGNPPGDLSGDHVEASEPTSDAAVTDKPESMDVAKESKPQPVYPQYLCMLRHNFKQKPTPTFRITKRCQTRYWKLKKERAMKRRYIKRAQERALRDEADSGKSKRDILKEWAEEDTVVAKWQRQIDAAQKRYERKRKLLGQRSLPKKEEDETDTDDWEADFRLHEAVKEVLREEDEEAERNANKGKDMDEENINMDSYEEASLPIRTKNSYGW